MLRRQAKIVAGCNCFSHRLREVSLGNQCAAWCILVQTILLMSLILVGCHLHLLFENRSSRGELQKLYSGKQHFLCCAKCKMKVTKLQHVITKYSKKQAAPSSPVYPIRGFPWISNPCPHLIQSLPRQAAKAFGGRPSCHGTARTFADA